MTFLVQKDGSIVLDSEIKYYSYIFVEKDMIPAQVAIQASHAAMKLGCFMTNGGDWSSEEISPDTLNYVLVENFTTFEDLENILDKELGITYVTFEDHNYTWVDDKLEASSEKSVKSLMTYPIEEQSRGILKGLPLWRYK